LERGKLRNQRVFLKVADTLDCTTDFLFRRGPFAATDDSDALRNAASAMAFEVFERRINVSARDKARCRRLLGHVGAPLTADAWQILAEMITLAIDPPTPVAGRIGA